MILILGAIFLAGFVVYLYLTTGRSLTKQTEAKREEDPGDSEDEIA